MAQYKWIIPSRPVPRNAYGELLKKNVDPGLANVGYIDTRAILGDLPARIGSKVSSEIDREILKRMGAWAKALESNTGSREALSKINKNAVIQGQDAALREYKLSHPNRPTYRQNDNSNGGQNKRYSGGWMEQGLKSHSLYKTTYNRIYFGNKKTLDRYAKQWYRLNFGAGIQSTGPPVTPMMFFGRKSAKSFNLQNYSASAHFKIPKGGFFSATFSPTGNASYFKNSTGTGDAFYLRGAKGRKGGGVNTMKHNKLGKFSGSYFLNKGVNKINEVYPQMIENQFRAWEMEARNSMKASI